MTKLTQIAVLFGLMCLNTCTLLLVSGIPLSSPSTSWQFAVTSKTKIGFYDQMWKELISSAHQFDELTALTFDETQEILYFSDGLHREHSIFSLKIPMMKGKEHIIENVVQRTGDDKIRGIAYDPLDRKLYWTDVKQRKIFVLNIDEPTSAEIFLDVANEGAGPNGLALDICRRQMYWTNVDNSSIESIALDGNERRVIVKNDMRMPNGIVVDQLTDRIYWVVDQPGNAFSVESAKLDGSDRHVIVPGTSNKPLNLAVTKDKIFWTDYSQNAVWSHPKYDQADKNNTEEPKLEKKFSEKIHGIVARIDFFQTMQNDEHCNKIVTEIKQRMLTPKVTRSPTEPEMIKKSEAYCLNNGVYMDESDICINCQEGFTGVRCEINQCHNYCVHGTCKINNSGFPTCYCQAGFHGERCQSSKCESYCFNEGNCKIGSNFEPICECLDNYGGPRCEHNSTEICSLYCRILKHEPETYAPYGCHDICENLASQTEDGINTYSTPRYPHLEVCQNKSIWTSYVIITIVGGVVSCLALIAVIVHGLRRIYKPARPRIKKTFVVRKQARTNSASDTPLTNRPLATEQCEITIENCCNMNICETPCFDPKLVEQTLSSRDTKVRVKEDKKILIHSMEDDLY